MTHPLVEEYAGWRRRPSDAAAFVGSGRSVLPEDNPAFRIVNPVELQGKRVPEREWIIDQWFPVGVVTTHYGDGGTGKTLLAQQLMTACATNRPWCGMEVMQCQSLGLFCEDNEAELHARQQFINEANGLEFSDLGQMPWISGVGIDNMLVGFTADGRMHETKMFKDISEAAQDFKARLLVLDTAADLFGGNENERRQVRQFISLLSGLAFSLNAGVLLNAHPSRTGLATGNLDGGSTAWNNSARSRWSLSRPAGEKGGEPDDNTNLRILKKRKANYSSIGETVQLQWHNGVLKPESQVNVGLGAAERAAAEVVFLNLLAQWTQQERWVSASDRASNYAPKEFAASPQRQGYSKSDFAGAMRRLFDAKRIRNEDYGRKGDARQRIAADAAVCGGYQKT